MGEVIDDDIELVYSKKPIEPCWPFWGLLETAGKGAYSRYGQPPERIVFSCPIPDIFGRLSLIARNALAMLRHRSLDDLRYVAGEISTEIADNINESIEQETESRVQTLYSDGGWELAYLTTPLEIEEAEYNGYSVSITEDRIRDLLANWSSEWERPSVFGIDDYDELTVLKEC
jgi:hypothetical protein